MPIKNDRIVCVNHPTEKMFEDENKFILHNTIQGDDEKYYETKGAFIGNLYVCPICGYVELYNLDELDK